MDLRLDRSSQGSRTPENHPERARTGTSPKLQGETKAHARTGSIQPTRGSPRARGDLAWPGKMGRMQTQSEHATGGRRRGADLAGEKGRLRRATDAAAAGQLLPRENRDSKQHKVSRGRRRAVEKSQRPGSLIPSKREEEQRPA